MLHRQNHNSTQARLVKIEKNDSAAVARTRRLIKLAYDAEERAHKLSPTKMRKTIRIRDIERVLAFNYRGPLPDDDAGLEDLKIMIHHLIRITGDHAVHCWVERWAPWATTGMLDAMIAAAKADPRAWIADELADEMQLTFDIRQALGITTIGAIDLDKDGREHRRVDRDKARKAAQRRKRGAKPRAEYEAKSANRNKPWTAAGKSRATYYRELKTKRESETGAATALERELLVRTDLSHTIHSGPARPQAAPPPKPKKRTTMHHDESKASLDAPSRFDLSFSVINTKLRFVMCDLHHLHVHGRRLAAHADPYLDRTPRRFAPM